MPSLGIAPGSEGCTDLVPYRSQSRHRFQASFRWMRTSIFWRLGFKQSSLRHITRATQSTVPNAWTQPLVSWHAIFPGQPFGARSAIRPRNLPSSSSRLHRGCDSALRGAQPPLDLAAALRAVRGGVDQPDAELAAGPQQPGVDVGAAVVDVVPTSAQRRLCRPGGYADLDEDRLLSGGARAEVVGIIKGLRGRRAGCRVRDSGPVSCWVGSCARSPVPSGTCRRAGRRSWW